MKKIFVALLTFAMIFSLCACAGASYTSTTTTTTTDADGNSTTTTTTTTNTIGDAVITAAQLAEDGAEHKASFNVTNKTDRDIVQMYVALPEDESWGDNILDDPIKAGENTADLGWTMTYSKDYLQWQIDVVDSEGNEHSFDWDLSDCDGEALNVEFEAASDGWSISFY